MRALAIFIDSHQFIDATNTQMLNKRKLFIY